jgi:hypothetical protein
MVIEEVGGGRGGGGGWEDWRWVVRRRGHRLSHRRRLGAGRRWRGGGRRGEAPENEVEDEEDGAHQRRRALG